MELQHKYASRLLTPSIRFEQFLFALKETTRHLQRVRRAHAGLHQIDCLVLFVNLLIDGYRDLQSELGT